MNNKKGISLITLIVTIIVIIILAGSIMLSLDNTKIVSNAHDASLYKERESVISAYNLLFADYHVYEAEKTGTPVIFDTETLEKRLGKPKDYFKNRYKIENQKLYENKGTASVPNWVQIKDGPNEIN